MIQIDCAACKTESTMEQSTINKFGWFVRLVGYIISLPSIIGCLSAGSVFVSTVKIISSNETQAAAVVGIGVAAVLLLCSLAGGVVGWLLLSKTKVYRCTICGYIINRA